MERETETRGLTGHINGRIGMIIIHISMFVFKASQLRITEEEIRERGEGGKFRVVKLLKKRFARNGELPLGGGESTRKKPQKKTNQNTPKKENKKKPTKKQKPPNPTKPTKKKNPKKKTHPKTRPKKKKRNHPPEKTTARETKHPHIE